MESSRTLFLLIQSKCVFKKSAFQHRESGENLKKEERSVGNLHEHRTSKVDASFDVESAFRTTS
ncbi:hypothetical protein A616_25265 [Brevibacillus brevis X23]|nr:hypothetical protein A616_25265 [Brevibacillus brevis X23]